MSAKVFTIGGHTISYGGVLLREKGFGGLNLAASISGSGHDASRRFDVKITFDRPTTFTIAGASYGPVTSTTLSLGPSNTPLLLDNIEEGTGWTVEEILTDADIDAGYSSQAVAPASGEIGIDNTTVDVPFLYQAAPYNLAPKTIRFEFGFKGYDPTQSYTNMPAGATWTRVSSSPNVWDYHNDSLGADEFDSSHATTGGEYGHFWQNDTGSIRVIAANLAGVTTCEGMFRGISSLISVENVARTQRVTTTARMFDSSGLRTLEAFDTGSVTYMDGMFYRCQYLTSVPLLDTRNAVSMGSMFSESGVTTIPAFNTANVTNMSKMFYDCHSLSSVPLLNTSKVTNMSNMFYHCIRLKTVPLFDMSSVKDASYMFRYAFHLETVPLFNLSSVQYMRGMFSGDADLTYYMALQAIPDFNLPSVINVSMAFSGCVNVASGITRIYQKMAARVTSSSNYKGAFYQCGADTTTGRTELAQIPSGWKGHP